MKSEKVLWKNHRLRKNREFQNLINKGKKINRSNFVVFYKKNNTGNCRFGISVPQKFFKKATARNFYKRQVRQIIIDFLKKQKIPFNGKENKNHDLVVIIRLNYLEKNFLFNKEELFKILSIIKAN